MMDELDLIEAELRSARPRDLSPDFFERAQAVTRPRRFASSSGKWMTVACSVAAGVAVTFAICRFIVFPRHDPGPPHAESRIVSAGSSSPDDTPTPTLDDLDRAAAGSDGALMAILDGPIVDSTTPTPELNLARSESAESFADGVQP